MPTSLIELRKKIAEEIYPDVMRSMRVDELERELRQYRERRDST